MKTIEKPKTEDLEYFKMLRRMLKSACNRIADGDDIAIREMAQTIKFAEDCLQIGISVQVCNGTTWDQAGKALDISRQGAYQRFGKNQRTKKKTQGDKRQLVLFPAPH